MEIINFIEQFYLHDSIIENIGYTFFKDQFVITVNFCNWLQPYFKDGIDSDHIIGNFIFKGVKDLEVSPTHFTFRGLEILDVHYESGMDLDKITFVVEIGKHEDILVLSFRAKEVEWIPIETYNDE